MSLCETHYYKAVRGDDANYYRLRVFANTRLSDTEFREGWFPATAVDSVFGDVTSENGAKAYETRRTIEGQIQDAVIKANQEWLDTASDPDATPEELEMLLEARRRLLAYPISKPGHPPGTYEIEFNPMSGVAVKHSDEKLIFVLSANPDEIVGKIANFAENDKTVFSINQFAKVTAQRVRNDVAAQEATEEVSQKLDVLVLSQIKKAKEVLGDGDSTKRSAAISEIDTLQRLIDSIPH